MQKAIIVTKFGGTSVTPENRDLVGTRLATLKSEGYGVVAVISAMRAKGRREIYSTDALIEEAETIGEDVNLRSRDLLLSCGEIISTTLMAHYMSTHYPWQTTALSGGQAGIVTDFKYGDASIIAIYPDYIRKLLEEDQIVFVAGFQGVTDVAETESGYHGAITTLGRGGSDATACALGHALQAERVDIYTDVPGVMTADPDIFRDLADSQKPFPHSTVTYEDICEMAHLGAGVIQARAAEIAMMQQIRLRVASTIEECEGTLITSTYSDSEIGKTRITSIVNSETVFHVDFSIDHPEDKAEVEQEVLRLLGEAGVSIYFVNSTLHSTSFVVTESSLDILKELLYGLVIPLRIREEAKVRLYVLGPLSDSIPHWSGKSNVQHQSELLRERLSDAEVEEVEVRVGGPSRIVSVIGPNLKHIPGVALQVTHTLEERDVEILEIAESKNSLSCLILEHELVPAVQALHQRLIIERALDT